MTASPFIEPLPPAVGKKVEAARPPGEQVVIQLASDLTDELAFGERWLVVTEQRVLLLSADSTNSTFDLPLGEITETRLEGLVGGGRLVLERNGEAPAVLYFSSSSTAKFAEAARGIQQLCQGKALALSAARERTRCPKCHRWLPEKNGLCPACVPKRATLRRLLGYLKPYRGKAALLGLVLAAGTMAELLPPLLIQHIVDDVLIPRTNFGLLLGLVLGLLSVRLLMWLTEAGRGWLSAWLGGQVTADIRAELYRRLQHLPLRFHGNRPVGTLMSRMTKDVERVEEFLASALPLLFVNGLMLAGILMILFSTSWVLALYVLLLVPPIVLGAFLIWGPLRRAWERQSARWSRLSTHLNELLSGIRVVKAFCQERREAMRFDTHNEELLRAGVHAERRSFVYFTTIYFLMSLGLVVVWYVGGRQVLRGELTLGELLAVIAYLWMLYWPLQWFGQIHNAMTQAATGAERIFEVLDAVPESADDPSAVPLPRLQGRVVFRNVTFGYDPAKRVLHDINWDVAPGETIGVVGRSGSGKTTALSLLCRFYDPDQGSVEVDGIDLGKARLRDLREQIAVVPQGPFLFSGTIVENISYGCAEASLEEVIQAAKAADAHRFILARPDGYDTEVGERGQHLSGGERQRIAIARALVLHRRILILDEATSAVDAPSEKLIRETLGRLAGGCTTFIIAHRLSTVRNADRFLALDNGRVAEIGTYEELMTSRGVFHDLVTTQQGMNSALDDGEGRRLQWEEVGDSSDSRSGGLLMESSEGQVEPSPTDRTTANPVMVAQSESVDPKQVWLVREPRGELRLMIGEGRSHEKIRIVRAAPLSDPRHYISFLDEQGEEICMIRDPADLDESTRQILNEELDRRYLTAVVCRIYSVRNEPGVSYFDVETNRGRREFIVQNVHESLRRLDDRRFLFLDVDGNRFEISDLDALEKRSVRLLKPLL